MARYDDDLMKTVRQLYWPRVDEEGVAITPGYNGTYDPQSTDAYDPNVVWVGPFTDAMIHFGLFADRQLFKAFMFEVNDKGPADGWEFTLERCLDIGETAWPHLDATYPPRREMVELRALSGAPGDTADPGEIKNSPTNVGGEGTLFPSVSAKEYKVVTIAVDPQYKLHILRRGDRIRKDYRGQQGHERRKEVYSLRPLHEGPSIIPGTRGEQPRRA